MSEFVYALTAEGRSGCKIGYSKDPKSRVKSISYKIKKPCKIRALVKCTGTWGRTVEREVHRVLEDQRIENEWFNTTPDVVRSIATRFVKVNRRQRKNWRIQCRLQDKFYASEKALLDHNARYMSTRVPPETLEALKKLSGERGIDNLLAAILMRVAEDPMLLDFLELPDAKRTNKIISCEFRQPELWTAMEEARADLVRHGVEYTPYRGLK